MLRQSTASRLNTSGVGGTGPVDENVGQGELWQRMLGELAGQTKTQEDRHVIILGDNDAGKCSLIETLQKRNETEENSLKAPLGYTYFDVHNPEDDVDEIMA
eukprot:GFYU01016035.1.p1 GENE.GFYU01016035.1~~GFYU01016035.1.p1  ORF type:complete len:102 (-),score=25.98 GFYU01016035.1:22-327(-)